MSKHFDFVLTDNCNRNCRFCYVNKTGFFATKSDVDKFCAIIKEETEKTKTKQSVTLFGGEPLLNIECVEHLVSELKKLDCDIHLTTNGDLLSKHLYDTILKGCKIHVTAYDIFENVEKYKKIIDIVDNGQLSFSFTFDETTISKAKEFIDLTYELGVKHKVAFSHSPKSWENISIESLKDIVYDIYCYEFNRFFDNFLVSDGYIPDLLYSKFCMIYGCWSDCKPIDVICHQSMNSFYNGKLINGCIRYHNRQVPDFIPKRCVTCDWRYMCKKSCSAEWVDGDVPEKLCAIELAGFYAMSDSIHKKLLLNNKETKEIFWGVMRKLGCKFGTLATI